MKRIIVIACVLFLVSSTFIFPVSSSLAKIEPVPATTQTTNIELMKVGNNITGYYNNTTEIESMTSIAIMSIILFIILAMSLLILGWIFDKKYLILSGLIWIGGAVLFFSEFNEFFVLVCLAVGMITIIEGGLSILEEEKEKI